MARPKGTTAKTDIPSLIDRELDKKVNGWTKRALIAKGIVNAALPRNEEGIVHPDGKIDVKSAEFFMNRRYGKPVENRTTQVSVIHHYPQLENSVNLADFDRNTIEVQPLEAVTQ